MAEKIFKVCNCCLTCHQTPRLMGVRAKVQFCRKCKARTVWSTATEEQVAAYHAHRARMAALIDSLIDSLDT